MSSDFSFFALSSAVLLSGLLAHYRLGTDRQTSWVLTLLTSGSLSITCFFFLFHIWASGGWTHDLLYCLTATPERNSVIFFLTHLLWDSFFALTIYPKKELKSTLLHHSFYITLCLFVLHKGWVGALVAAFPLEIPTFFLALGHVFPTLRADKLFGATFFLTRLMWHVYLMYIIYSIPPRDFEHLWLLAVGPLMMHIYWFYWWSKKYGSATIASKKE